MSSAATLPAGLPAGLPPGGPALPGRDRSLGGRARFATRYFLRLLRTHPSYAAGYAIVAVVVVALAAPLVAVFGQSMSSIIFAIAFVNAPIYLRLMRSQVLSIRQMRYVEAAFVSGMSDGYIIRRHVVPNAMAPVLAQLSVNIGWSILLTAGLSFVGAGVRAPTPEWGSMIATGFPNVMTGQWWPSVFPGLALAVTVYGFALIGTSIEFMADPRRRRTLATAGAAL